MLTPCVQQSPQLAFQSRHRKQRHHARSDIVKVEKGVVPVSSNAHGYTKLGGGEITDTCCSRPDIGVVATSKTAFETLHANDSKDKGEKERDNEDIANGFNRYNLHIESRQVNAQIQSQAYKAYHTLDHMT